MRFGKLVISSRLLRALSGNGQEGAENASLASIQELVQALVGVDHLEQSGEAFERDHRTHLPEQRDQRAGRDGLLDAVLRRSGVVGNIHSHRFVSYVTSESGTLLFAG